MKFRALILAFGCFVGAAPMAQAGDLPPGPLEKLQDAFGAIVGANFRVPDQIAGNTGGKTAVDPTVGKAYYESLAIPGSIFAGMYQPFAAAEGGSPPPPADAAAVPRKHRHARLHRRVSPATAG